MPLKPMTPSERVLSSWRDHAREGWEVEKYRHYPQRIMLGSWHEMEIRAIEMTERARMWGQAIYIEP